ncbi:hypothetical protein [Sunxiuqinia sp. sy24]|uniref:hypothetical protein n=1 Tax=Sunxiuqinia sp. sy24 TaxID=3461495 RepID=UPI00404621D8
MNVRIDYQQDLLPPTSPTGEERVGRKFGPGQLEPCGWKDEIFRIFLCFPARPAGGRFFSSEKK